MLLANSIPTYPNTPLNPDNRKITFGSRDVENTIITIEDHGFFTGDGVFYSPGTITLTSTTPDGFIEETQVESKFKGVDTGVYYIYKINENQFSLSRSRSDIYVGVFVQLTTLICWLKITHSHTISLLVKVLMRNQSSNNLLIQ